MRIKWGELLIAFLIAFGFWYVVTGSEKLESHIDVRVDYRGVPTDLIVRDGMVNKVTVRVRASAGMLRSMYEREYMLSLNLSTIAKGENIISVPVNQIPFLGGVEVIETIPSNLKLLVDSIETKRVPLYLELVDELFPNYLAKVKMFPEEVSLKGPSEVLKGVSRVTVDLVLTGDPVEGVHNYTRSVAVPDGVEATPSVVTLEETVSINRKEISFILPVKAFNNKNMEVKSDPEKIKITAQIPVAEIADKNIKEKVLARAIARNSAKVKPEIKLPENSILIRVEPQEITILSDHLVDVKEKLEVDAKK